MPSKKKIVTQPRAVVSEDQKAYLAKRRKQHNLDRKQAEMIRSLGIHHAPLDLPSLHRAVHGYGTVPWLTTGYDWQDKPHRVANSATEEIRALRTYILNTLSPKKVVEPTDIPLWAHMFRTGHPFTAVAAEFVRFTESTRYPLSRVQLKSNIRDLIDADFDPWRDKMSSQQAKDANLFPTRLEAYLVGARKTHRSDGIRLWPIRTK